MSNTSLPLNSTNFNTNIIGLWNSIASLRQPNLSRLPKLLYTSTYVCIQGYTIGNNSRILMGYLSCKAESTIATALSHASTSTPSSNKFHRRSDKRKEKENPVKIQEFNYEDLEVATENFSDAQLLGRGSHGLVYKGVLQGGRLVAIKKPSRAAQRLSISANPSEFENEIDILSKLQSPRLVNLVGFTKNDSQDRLLVVEFMSNGTLYDVLHSNPRPPTWGRRIKLALQIAKAIETLHSLSPPVIHRDIKSANVLIDSNFNARLGDFGLALRCVDDEKLRSTPPAGTMGYLDPCYVTPDNLSTKTDVFSFGILLLEIVSGRKAIDMAHSPPSVVDWAIPLIRRGKFLSIYDPRVVPPKERRPVQPARVRVNSKRMDHGDAKVGIPLRNPRRVYSDLGVRRNLMDLMSSLDNEANFHVEDNGSDITWNRQKGLQALGLKIKVHWQD
ncbi:Serine/threonine-protein kinase-like protein [Sesamum angolense]|uniref:Serine/threonine-protein kinase-like protein n=1 Tax=Sesamum angolense TaxID=2727404 RepID=A0AAE1VXE5_9LAMI|nr:Serine/threonine-protein kinase-like protein [Sesamum angolense]